jgi:hypothetical protein
MGKRQLTRFAASFISHNNRHLKSMCDQNGFGNAEGHALSIGSPNRLLTDEDFGNDGNLCIFMVLEFVFNPVLVKNRIKNIDNKLAETTNKLCLYGINNTNRKKLFSAHSYNRRVRQYQPPNVRTIEKPKSLEMTRASINTYFAIKSQDKPNFQAITLSPGFQDQDLHVFILIYFYSLMEASIAKEQKEHREHKQLNQVVYQSDPNVYRLHPKSLYKEMINIPLLKILITLFLKYLLWRWVTMIRT